MFCLIDQIDHYEVLNYPPLVTQRRKRSLDNESPINLRFKSHDRY